MLKRKFKIQILLKTKLPKNHKTEKTCVFFLTLNRENTKNSKKRNLKGRTITKKIFRIIKTISHDEVLNRFIGKKGTPKRIEFENELKAEILASQFKELRKSKHLTQLQFAEIIGMEKGQISKIENGKFNLTLVTINKIATALGARVSFDLQPV